MLIENGYLVLTCGCTDCFPTAIFFNREEAGNYARNQCNGNPEGYLIHEIDVSLLGLQDD